ATSGSRTTTFLTCSKRPAYFPRTPPEKSYSARIPSPTRRLLEIRIASPLTPRGDSSTDDADGIASIGMDDDQQALEARDALEDKSVLFERGVRIEYGQRKRIGERRQGLVERAAMFCEVRVRPRRIPLEPHPQSIGRFEWTVATAWLGSVRNARSHGADSRW